MEENIVHSLLGHGQMEVALRCYRSLVKTSAEPVGFILHDDGSLSDEDVALLRNSLPVRRLIRRPEADALLEEKLAHRPFCARYRREQPLALKLLVVALLGSGPLYFCDSDVLFLAPHAGLFPKPLTGAQAIFMRDIREPYALRPWQVWPLARTRLLSRLNTGLMAFSREAYDLDFIDHFLKRHANSAGFRLRPGWIEQTAWSALAARLVSRFYDPGQIAIAHGGLRVAAETVAVHFVSSHRGMIEGMPAEPSTGAPQTIRTTPCRPATAFDLLAHDVKARWQRK